MDNKPQAYLADLSPEEKTLLNKILKSKLTRNLIIKLPIIIICAYNVFYLNNHKRLEINENLLTVYNLVFVLFGAFFLKLLLNNIVNYNREKDAWQKKVIQGRIAEKKSGKIKIGEYHLRIDNFFYEKIEAGESVEVYLSPKTEIFLGLKKK